MENYGVYGASKAAIVAFTKTTAREFVGDGIRCNVVTPGAINTPMLAAAVGANTSTSETQAALDAIPMKRIGEPKGTF